MMMARRFTPASLVTTPDVSVIIPTRNRPSLLAECLTCVLAQKTQRSFEVIVVNDGGDLPPLGQLEDQRVSVVRTPTGSGPARARNRGLAVARAPLILFTDDDARPEVGWIDAAASTLETAPGAVGVEGPIEGGAFDPLFEHSIHNESPGAYYTCNVGYRRDALAAVGGFDVSFPNPHCEDIDLGRRVARLGPILFVPRMRVVHPPRPLGFLEHVRRARMIESEWLLHRRHPDTLASRWSIRWAPLMRMMGRWRRLMLDGSIVRGSARRAIRVWALAVAQLAFGLYTTMVRWDRPRPVRTSSYGVLMPFLNVSHEIAEFSRKASDRRSLGRFAIDSIAYRALRLIPRRAPAAERRIVLNDGTALVYRRNRGDIQTLREVWIDEIYRLPSGFTPRVVLDLGANIGLSGVWFGRQYESHVTAVEPVAANVRLARENFRHNGVAGTVLAGAIGLQDGFGRFVEGVEPNLGRFGPHGAEVRVFGIDALVQRLGMIDLVKIDIEGAEGSLFSGAASWLDACSALIVEFHPEHVDRDEIASRICDRGFSFYPAGTFSPKTADIFARPNILH